MGTSAKQVVALFIGLSAASCSSGGGSHGGVSSGAGSSTGSTGGSGSTDAGAPSDSSGPDPLDGSGSLDGGSCGTVLTGTDAGTALMVTTPGPASDAVMLLPFDATTIDALAPTVTFGPSVDTAGNVYVSAVFPTGDAGSLGTGFVKIRPDHTLEWATEYDRNWLVADGKVDSAGNTVLATSLLSSPPDTSQKAVTTKYGPDGTQTWSQQYQLGSQTSGFALALGPDGSVVTLGTSSLPGDPYSHQGILFLVKYAADGTQQWSKSYCYGGLPRSAAIDADGNIYASLRATPGSFAKFTADGTEVYRRSFSGPRDTGELVFSTDGQALYLFDADPDVGTAPVGLRRVDPKTGDVAWAMNVGASTAAGDPAPGVNWTGMVVSRRYMAVTADTIYVAGSYTNSYSSLSVRGTSTPFVAAYDPTSGKQKWFQQVQRANTDGGILSPFFGGLTEQPYLGVDPTGNAVVLDQRYPPVTNETTIWRMSPTGAYTAF